MRPKIVRDVEDDVDAAFGEIVDEQQTSAFDSAFSTLVDSAARATVESFPLADDDVTVSPDHLAFDFGRYAFEPPPSWPADVIAERQTQMGGLGGYLAELAPGPLLGRVLAAIDPAQVDDYSLVEVVAANKRMESWYAGRVADAAAGLSTREALDPTGAVTMKLTGAPKCLAAEEVRMRLGISRLAARRLVVTGRALRGNFRFTAEALDAGEIDFAKAQTIVAALVDLREDVALAAQFEVLEKAPARTLHQLRQDLARATIAVDPEDADARHHRARQERRVNRPKALPDGMAYISGVLPAGDAIGLDLALDAAARAAKHNGDGRTLDQLRADSLALLGHTATAIGHIGPHPATHCTCGCTAVDAPPSGPAPTHDDDATSTASTVDPHHATSLTGASSTAVSPSSADPSRGRDPAPGSDPAPEAPHPRPEHPSAPTPRGEVCPRPADGPPLPGHRLPGGRLPVVRLGMLGGGRADVRVTVPLSVLLPEQPEPGATALDREPVAVAELEGYGPVPPEVARALAAGGTWRRLVTDPTGATVVDVGRTRYQPPAAMAARVRERDRTCVCPGCSTPARSCDLDHRHEWQHGGHTSEANLDPLCRRSHALKSIGAFTVARASDGTYAWTTPTGHGYLRHRDGRTTMLPHGAAAALDLIAHANRPDRPNYGRPPSYRDDAATIDHVIARALALPATPLASTLSGTPAAHYLPDDDEPLPF